MAPPIGGPTSGPTRAGIVNQAMAETRSERGTARTRSSRPTGVIMAPPIPCRNRAATKPSSDPAMAQASEPRTKIPIAQRNTVLAPNRSAIRPEIGMKTASET